MPSWHCRVQEMSCVQVRLHGWGGPCELAGEGVKASVVSVRRDNVVEELVQTRGPDAILVEYEDGQKVTVCPTQFAISAGLACFRGQENVLGG